MASADAAGAPAAAVSVTVAATAAAAVIPSSDVDWAPVGSTTFTATVYVHPALVRVRSDASNHTLQVTAAVAAGTLLLIDHMLGPADPDTLAACVARDPRLTALLCPRAVDAPVAAKVESNCFVLEHARALGRTLSAANHACVPSAAYRPTTLQFPDGTRTVFFSVYALKTLAAGADVTLCYGPTHGHEAHGCGFACACGLSLADRMDPKRGATTDKLLAMFSSQPAAVATRNAALRRYLVSDEAAMRVARHELAPHGCWLLAPDGRATAADLPPSGPFSQAKAVGAHVKDARKRVSSMLPLLK
jgi:hypothetical protein